MIKEAAQFTASAVGRDRINRFLQYLCKFILSLEGRFQPLSSDVTSLSANMAAKEAPLTFYARLRALQSAVVNTRKCMRVGRQIEYAYVIQKSPSIFDDVVRVMMVMKSLGLGLWLAHDSVHWAHSAGIVRVKEIQRIARRGYFFWFVALLASFLAGLYKLRQNAILFTFYGRFLTTKRVSQQQQQQKGEDSVATQALVTLKDEKRVLMLGLIQDALDMLIPISGMDWIGIDPVWVGLAGVVTSVSGGYQHFQTLK